MKGETDRGGETIGFVMETVVDGLCDRNTVCGTTLVSPLTWLSDCELSLPEDIEDGDDGEIEGLNVGDSGTDDEEAVDEIECWVVRKGVE